MVYVLVSSTSNQCLFVHRLSNKPKRKFGIISSFGKPAKGVEGARAFHEANEENIMSHRRCGLNDEDLLY